MAMSTCVPSDSPFTTIGLSCMTVFEVLRSATNLEISLPNWNSCKSPARSSWLFVMPVERYCRSAAGRSPVRCNGGLGSNTEGASQARQQLSRRDSRCNCSIFEEGQCIKQIQVVPFVAWIERANNRADGRYLRV